MSMSYLPATFDSIEQALTTDNLSESISMFYRILEDPSSSPDTLSNKEQVISMLLSYLLPENRVEDLRNLVTQLRPFFSLITKSRTARIVLGIIGTISKIPGTIDVQISLCKEVVQWARLENRTSLRHRVELRLATALSDNKDHSEAFNILTELTKEATRLDDKSLLVEIHLVETKIHFSLRNLPRAKLAFAAVRTGANAIQVPPALQGAIDFQNGILHIEEKDYSTAYIYFLLALEVCTSLSDHGTAVIRLKYMSLCLIMSNRPHYVELLVSNLWSDSFRIELDTMKAVADALSKRSLKLFKTAIIDFKVQLQEDLLVHRHLSFLYDTMLELNLCRSIEPFSRVEIAYIADLIELPVDQVEESLSRMILDKKFAGALDQGTGCIIIFDDPEIDGTYEATLEAMSNINKVFDSLYVRSAKIMA